FSGPPDRRQSHFVFMPNHQQHKAGNSNRVGIIASRDKGGASKFEGIVGIVLAHGVPASGETLLIAPCSKSQCGSETRIEFYGLRQKLKCPTIVSWLHCIEMRQCTQIEI